MLRHLLADTFRKSGVIHTCAYGERGLSKFAGVGESHKIGKIRLTVETFWLLAKFHLEKLRIKK